jgi:TPP-dependent pyruvate/acetoin dehydrogenase alpha subunit
MNLAALWHLPILFLCENNLYAMGTRLDRAQSQTDLTIKAGAYGIRSDAVDGMDILAVERATREAVERVRHGGGPTFLECRTYRFRAHSMFDAELYRDKAEVDLWKTRDPIPMLAGRLVRWSLATDTDLAAIETAVAAEIAAAVQFAEAGSWEPVEDLTTDVTAKPPGVEGVHS